MAQIMFIFEIYLKFIYLLKSFLILNFKHILHCARSNIEILRFLNNGISYYMT